MKTTWAVVADEAITRILQWPETGDVLEPVEELTDPTAHSSGTELRRDAHGRRAGGGTMSQRAGNAGSITASAGEAEKHQEAELFARRVADRLKQALQQKRFEELRIAAAPRFLGLLRKELSGEVARTVSTELSKDLIHADNREISQRLFPENAADSAL